MERNQRMEEDIRIQKIEAAEAKRKEKQERAILPAEVIEFKNFELEQQKAKVLEAQDARSRAVEEQKRRNSNAAESKRNTQAEAIRIHKERSMVTAAPVVPEYTERRQTEDSEALRMPSVKQETRATEAASIRQIELEEQRILAAESQKAKQQTIEERKKKMAKAAESPAEHNGTGSSAKKNSGHSFRWNRREWK